MTRPILDIQDLSISFNTEQGWVDAVKHVSFTVKEGQTIGIVGESGSGKSVTSLMTMGLVPMPPGKVKSGRILFSPDADETLDLLTLTEKQYQKIRGNKIAMIFQEPMTSLNPVYPCGKQVMEALLIHQKLTKKQAKERTIALFNEVLLPNPPRIFDAYPHELSGGQKQRVMIAMAISCQPKILIADEPTTALDVSVQKTILELLKSLQEKYRMSVIFITHDLGIIADIADEIVVMYKGEIVEKGTTKEVFYSPQHPYTKGLIACKPTLDSYTKRLPQVADFLQEKYTSKADFIAQSPVKTPMEDKQSAIPFIEIRHVGVHYATKKSLFGKVISHFKALDNISLSVYAGETLGVVGESGCGKTTLGRTLLQLIKPSEGEILYQGKPLPVDDAKAMKAFRKRMQIIFQDPYSSLNPQLTIGEAILEPMTVHKLWDNHAIRKEKVLELLHKVGLESTHYNRYPHEFSGGQRQRICIARALALQPEFIVCDESVSALDVSVQAQVLNLLNDLKEEFGFTYLFISHDLSVVNYFSDKMIVMHQGEIVEMGIPSAIYARPQSEYTRKLIDAIPKIK